MPVSKELLEILCCPKSRVSLFELTGDQITRLNEQIESRDVQYVDGKKVDKPLQEGLITEDKKTIYRVDDEIPIMLIDMGIPVEQFEDF